MTEAELIAKVREMARTLPPSRSLTEIRLFISYDRKTGKPGELSYQPMYRYAILAPTTE
jgi:hypothetical protein